VFSICNSLVRGQWTCSKLDSVCHNLQISCFYEGWQLNSQLTFCPVNCFLVNWQMLATISSSVPIICWIRVFCCSSKCCIDAVFYSFVKKLWVKKFTQNLQQDSRKVPKSWKNMVICDEAFVLVDRPRKKHQNLQWESPEWKLAHTSKTRPCWCWLTI
jgi:hypothetical protein